MNLHPDPTASGPDLVVVFCSALLIIAVVLAVFSVIGLDDTEQRAPLVVPASVYQHPAPVAP